MGRRAAADWGVADGDTATPVPERVWSIARQVCPDHSKWEQFWSESERKSWEEYVERMKALKVQEEVHDRMLAKKAKEAEEMARFIEYGPFFDPFAD